MLIENNIQDGVDFFHRDALSSTVAMKVSIRAQTYSGSAVYSPHLTEQWIGSHIPVPTGPGIYFPSRWPFSTMSRMNPTAGWPAGISASVAQCPPKSKLKAKLAEQGFSSDTLQITSTGTKRYIRFTEKGKVWLEKEFLSLVNSIWISILFHFQIQQKR